MNAHREEAAERGVRIHVIGPGPDPAGVVRSILQAESGDCVIVDLSMGHVAATDRLGSEVASPPQSRSGRVEWISGLEFAESGGDRSRAALVSWLSSIGRDDSSHAVPLREAFAYSRLLSLWWVLPSTKHHPLESPYPWLFFSIAVIEQVQDRFPGANWTIWGDADYVKAIASGIPGARGMRVGQGVSGKAGTAVRRLISLFAGVARALRWRSESPLPDELAPASRTRPLLLVHSVFPRFWKCGDGSTEPGCFDSYFAHVPRLLREQGLEVAWLPAFFPGDQREWRVKLDQQELPDAMDWMRLTPGAAVRILAYHALWIARYVWLFRIRGLHRRWRHRGYSIGHVLRREIRDQVTGGAVHALVQLEQQRHACTRLRPAAVVHRNEFLINGRIVDAAANGIAPTIAVQHGLLVRHVGVYQYDAQDIQDKPDPEGVFDFVRHCPAPEVLAVFGEYYREYFEELGGYPSRRLVPVGGIRHDRVSAAYLENEVRPRDRIASLREELGWPTEKPVLLLCATLPTDLEPWLRTTIAALRKIGQPAHIVIKPHPEYPVPDGVKGIASESGWDSVEISSGDIFKMLAASDVLLAGGSTTVLEAHLLDVPAVVFVPESGYEVYPFVAEGIGEPVRSADELAHALQRIIVQSDEYRSAFRERRARVLARHLNSADARAGHRLADLIWDVVRTRRSWDAEQAGRGSAAAGEGTKPAGPSRDEWNRNQGSFW